MRSTPSPSSGSRALRAAEHDGRDEQPQLVDLARVEERAGQMRPALQQHRGDAARAELVERASDARRLVLAGRDDRRRRRRSPARRSPAARRRARRTTVSGTSAACARAGSPAAAGRRSRRRRGAAGARRRRRAPSAAGRRPARCRCPTPTASSSRAPAVRARARLASPEIHFESPVRVATLPSSVIADLNSTNGRPVRACLRKAWLSSRARRGELAVGDVDVDALVAQDAQAAARGLLGRVVGGDDDAGDPGLQRSRRCTAASCPCGSTARARRRASRRAVSARRTRRAPSTSACGPP